MRTDSVNLSDTATDSLCEFIRGTYGADYIERRKFKNKNESAQEAHEAIRPSHFDAVTIEGTEEEQDLYRLIYMRAVASQMKAKETLVTTITINTASNNEEFQAKAKMITFDGYTRAYEDVVDEDVDEEETVEIKEILSEGDPMQPVSFVAETNFSRPKSRYGEAELVREMESLGIGRPSTYGPIIKNIKDTREYVSSGKVPGKVFEC
jgi:DNA topoisomerase-1